MFISYSWKFMQLNSILKLFYGSFESFPVLHSFQKKDQLKILKINDLLKQTVTPATARILTFQTLLILRTLFQQKIGHYFCLQCRINEFLIWFKNHAFLDICQSIFSNLSNIFSEVSLYLHFLQISRMRVADFNFPGKNI